MGTIVQATYSDAGSGAFDVRVRFVVRRMGICDGKGRILVAFSSTVHMGDSWEFLDEARYQARFSTLGTKIGVSYVLYPHDPLRSFAREQATLTCEASCGVTCQHFREDGFHTV